MARKIRKLKNPEQYEVLLQEVRTSITWKDIYHGKLADHYTALRRFLPKLYEALPLVSNTTDDSLIRGIDFLKRHSKTNQATLPGHGVPTGFLTAEWKRRALKKHTWREHTTASVQKAPYELALVDTMVKALETGALSIDNANRYGPLLQHLIPRQQFLSGYLKYLKKLGQPEAVCEYYAALRQDLEQSMLRFDNDYQILQDSFRINRNGTLSYKRTPPQILCVRSERLSETIQPYLPSVTILDVLLDIHALTGFMNPLKPINGRQSMSENERILRLLATIYAYGCNCGPTQAAQSIGLRKQDLLYMRRHYCGIKQLAEAASILADTYGTTAMAKHLGDPGIFMTDAMRFPALKKSLTARHHFRYGSGKSILLYQHVTANCICLFTQALLCNVSEAIHMLNGIMKHRTGMEPVINICDNAGKSDLVFGLAHLLNIQIRTVAPEAPLKDSARQELMGAIPAEPIQPFDDREQIRILLADDHKLMREALAKFLQGCKGMTIVGQAIDGREVVQLATQLKPHVILMDVTMPELDGFEATALISRDLTDIRIIGLSMHSNDHTRQKMFDAASAYLTKTDAPDTVVETILKLYHGTK